MRLLLDSHAFLWFVLNEASPTPPTPMGEVEAPPPDQTAKP